MRSDRNRRPTEARTLGSSSMTKTVGLASDIAAYSDERITEMSLCIGSQVWPGHAVLVPIRESEQSLSSPEHTRGIDESLLAQTQRCGLSGARPAQVSPRHKPKFTEHRHCGGDIL